MEKISEQATFDRKSLQLENLLRLGVVLTHKGEKTVQAMTVIGQIEGHYQSSEGQKVTKYEHIIPQLVAAENSDAVDGVLLLLNTVGGDVEAGLAIAELIAGMKKPTVSLVLGGGHSIGVPLAVAANTSFIVPSATMTVHPVRVNGVVLGVEQSFSYMERMQKRITDFVTAHSSISEERFMHLLLNTGEIATDMGTVLKGEEAVKEGLIDRVGGIADAFEELYRLMGASEKKSSEIATVAFKECSCEEEKNEVEKKSENNL